MRDPAYGLMHKQTLHDLVKENERLQARLAETEKECGEAWTAYEAAEADRDRYKAALEQIEGVTRKPNRVITPEWYWETVAHANQLARAALRAAATEEPA